MIDLKVLDNDSTNGDDVYQVENIPANIMQTILQASPAASTASSSSSFEPTKDFKQQIQQQLEQQQFEVTPEPGFVIKSRVKLLKNFNSSSSGQSKAKANLADSLKVGQSYKLFLNICHSIHVPAAPLITDEELAELMNPAASGEKMSEKFKVPMSLSEMKFDQDKAGTYCMVLDVCVHSDVFWKSQANEQFLVFLIELSMAFVNMKFKEILQFAAVEEASENSGYTIPRMKSKGPLSKHIIRRMKKPFIASAEKSMPSSTLPKTTIAPKITPIKAANSTPLLPNEEQQPKFINEQDEKIKSLPKPPYQIKLQKHQRKGIVHSLSATLELYDIPSLNADSNVIVEVEPLKLLFMVKDKYFCAIDLPLLVNSAECQAKFDRSTRLLTISMPSLE